MKMKPRRRAAVGVLATLMLAFITWRAAVLLLRSPLEISRETTYVTGPVKPDGSIDYPAALHELMSRGVNAEDNAAVLMAPLFGTARYEPAWREQYRQWLGAEQIPVTGIVINEPDFILQYLRQEGVDGESLSGLTPQFRKARCQGWTPSEFPLVAQWLEANASAFEIIEKSLKHSQYYAPLVGDESDFRWIISTDIAHQREIPRLLHTRAMLRLGQGDIDAAGRDLLMCHRFAMLACEHAPGTMAYATAVSFDFSASAGDQVFAAAKLTPAQFRAHLDRHQRLPPLVSPQKVFDISHRLISLSGVIEQFGQASLNYNVMLRKTNLFFDDLVAAEKLDRYTDRSLAIDAIENDFKSRIPAAKSSLQQAADVMFSSRKTISASVGDVLLLQSIPSYRNVDNWWTRSQVQRDLTTVALALSLYKSEHGQYPDQLDSLEPDYLSSIPIDRFTDLPLIYVSRDEGYRLYSRGPNGKDDGGESDSSKKQDDAAISVPHQCEE